MNALALFVLLLFQGTPPARTTGTITGQLQTTGGAPAREVRVQAVAVLDGQTVNAASIMLAGIAQTDANGRFRLENVPPGRYYITAGLLDSPTYYPGAATRAAAKIITIGPGVTLNGVDFSLVRPAAATVRGEASAFVLQVIGANTACTDQYFGILRVDDGSLLSERVELAINGIRVTSSRPRALCTVPNLEVFRDNSGEGLRLGQNRVEITRLPLGYYVKSMTYGTVDLAKSPVSLPDYLRNAKIEVVLTKMRPSGTSPGIKVSGRIAGLDMPRREDIRLELTSVSSPAGMPERPGHRELLADGKTGAFEIQDMSPGQYRLRVAPMPGNTLGLDSDFAGSEATFEVGGSDATNLEVRFEPTASRFAKPE